MPEESSGKHVYTPIPEPTSPAAMEALTLDEKILLTAQRMETSSRASLTDALMRMGRFDEALAVETDGERKAFIQALKEGEERDDSERCNCEHWVDVTDRVRYGEAIRRGERGPDIVQHPHYLQVFRYRSSTHGQMVSANQCHKCGHMQNIPGDIDALHTSFFQRQSVQRRLDEGLPGVKTHGEQ